MLTPNLMFDLGGVIMEIDRNRCVEAFNRLGMVDADDFLGVYVQSGPFLGLESGRLTPEEFRTEVRRHIPHPVTDEEIDTALVQFLIGIPTERLDTLRELRRRGHKVYMLSNTNPIMWHAFILPEFTKQGLDVNAYFDGIVTSYEAGVCKPDAAIYRLTESKFGIKPEETTFFDDGLTNVRAAEALGFKGVHVTENNPITELV